LKTFAASLLILLASTAYGAAPAPAPAATPSAPTPNWYNVEVIVFRATDPNAGSQETWPADPGLPDWNGALPLAPVDPAVAPVPYQLISVTAQQLDDAWARLKRSRNYEPLLHVAWSQPALDRANAPAVRLGVPASAVPAASTAPQPADAMPLPQATPVYGDAKLSTTGPYLHFDLDLILEGPLAKNAAPASSAISTTVLAPPGSTAVPAAPTFQLYRLRHDMRVNGGKLAYFDHPLFGAIVLVTPVRRQ
jgi:hypothetical protein